VTPSSTSSGTRPLRKSSHWQLRGLLLQDLQRDVRPFFDSVKLSVAPLRFGAGVKGKINQSMAFGVPVVATSLAVEGMDLTDHENILVADEPEDCARALIELYESEELWNRLSENGIRETRASYSTDAASKTLEFLFSDDHLGSGGQSVSVKAATNCHGSEKLNLVPRSEQHGADQKNQRENQREPQSPFFWARLRSDFMGNE